ncbi:MAG: dTDP-glucose 4,6-dehydratase [Candidatus Aminicenantes bacterium]|nr:dTDP-glucose 4,6-dehydratase [Candidatus Aminicenantes bacterium]
MFIPQNMMVTGGAGFIGSNFIHYIFKQPDFQGNIIDVDALSYAGNLENLAEIARQYGDKRYFFEKADVRDMQRMTQIFAKYKIDTVIHFAAETHVDRSIYGPAKFIETNILGTFILLETAREYWQNRQDVLFYYVSTDEVFGSLGETGYFYEHTPYAPRSPYSASKASACHLVKSYFHTYNLPVVISNCSNNYGPYQFPEKLIPLMTIDAMTGKPLPIYGDGKNIRDWLFVDDHCAAILEIAAKGKRGDDYNIGGDSEKTNIEVVTTICEILEELYPLKNNPAAASFPPGITAYRQLITFVKDRPGHDRRYAVDCGKIKKELGWRPRTGFLTGLRKTIRWYIDNPDWLMNIQSGEYQKWLEKNYASRSI